MSVEAGTAGANTSNPERLRERLLDLLSADRWVDTVYPAVAPISADEVIKLLQGYPHDIMVIGSGSSFAENYTPNPDALILLTMKLTGEFSHNVSDQVVEVSAGLPIKDVRRRLAAVGYLVPALERFDTGTIGGRLACIPSRQTGGLDGWVQSLLSLTVALPDGELLNLGSHCIKDVAGYDLRHIFTGSRGAFGVIVQAAFRCHSRASWRPPETPAILPSAGRIDPVWRKLLDPKVRMRPGL